MGLSGLIANAKKQDISRETLFTQPHLFSNKLSAWPARPAFTVTFTVVAVTKERVIMAAKWPPLPFFTPFTYFPYTAKSNGLFIPSSNIRLTPKPVAQKLQD